jgi:hypothetical protein
MYCDSQSTIRVRDEKKKYKLFTNNEKIPIKRYKNSIHNTNKW